MFAYESQDVNNILINKTYKNEEERQAILKYCLGNSGWSISALENKFYKNNIEQMKLKWKALRDSDTCVRIIVYSQGFFTAEEIELAWEVAMEEPNSCFKLLESLKPEQLGNRKWDIINTAILNKNYLSSVFRYISWKDCLEIIKRISKIIDEQKHLIRIVANFFEYYISRQGLEYAPVVELRKIAFDMIMQDQELGSELLWRCGDRLTDDEVKEIYKLHRNYAFDRAKEDYNNDKHKDISTLTRCFRRFRGFVDVKDEDYLVRKLKTKRHNQDINRVITETPLHQETVEKLRALQLMDKLV